MTEDGGPFNSDDFQKVCSTTDELKCFEDLPVPVARTPKANMKRILQELPTVRLLTLRDSIPQIVDILEKNVDKNYIAQALDAYAQLGIYMPEGLSERFNKGSSFNELDKDEDDDAPEDDLTEEDPNTHKKDMNHHYVLHQTDSKQVVDGVLSMKDGRAFSTEELEAICAADSALIKCKTGLPMVVVRATTEHLQRALKMLPDVAFDKLDESLPEIVQWLQEHTGLRNAKKLLKKYDEKGVPLPAEKILQEFAKEGKTPTD
jgi:hypothetical protein